MMYANCAYDVSAARRVLLGVEGAGVYLFEEPLAPDDLEGYRSLRGPTTTLSGAGENLFGKIGFRRWVSEGALDVLQPDLCSSGASPSAKKLAALAQAWNTAVVPHVWGTGVRLAASLQFIATLPPNPLSLNPRGTDARVRPLFAPLQGGPDRGAIRMKDGRVPVPQRPGIGVEVDRDVLARYARPARR